MRPHPPHHLSPAKQTTRQGVIPKGASTAPQPAQQRSDQGRKPVISEQDTCSLAWIIALMRGLSRERYRTVSSNPTLSANDPRAQISTSINRPKISQQSGAFRELQLYWRLPGCGI